MVEAEGRRGDELRSSRCREIKQIRSERKRSDMRELRVNRSTYKVKHNTNCYAMVVYLSLHGRSLSEDSCGKEYKITNEQ